MPQHIPAVTSRKLLVLAVLALIILGAMAQLYRLEEKSLWSDEVATIATSLGNSIDPEAWTLRHEAFDPPAPIPALLYAEKATRSHGMYNFARTAEVLKDNVHPPLFFWLMNLWIHAFGHEPGSLRLPAVFFGILCIPLMAAVALRIYRLNAIGANNPSAYVFAGLSAAFMALSAYQINHAQDARQYTVLVLLALLAVWLAVGLVQGKTNRNQRLGWLPWLALGLVLTAGLYTQYFFMLFTAFILLYLAWQGRNDRPFLLRLGLMAALIGLLWLPWLGEFKAQMVFLKSAGHYTAGLWNPVRLPEKLWRIFCEFFIPQNILGKVIPLLILLTGAGLSLFRRKQAAPAAPHPMLSPALSLILLWLVVVVGGQIALDLLKHTQTATIRRYLLLASPACYLLWAYVLVSISRGREQWAKVVAGMFTVLLLALMINDSAQLLLTRHTSSDEFKQAAAWINRDYRVGDTVLVNKSGAMAVGMALYLQPAVPMLGVDVPDYAVLQADSPLMRRLDSAANHSRRVWLVFSHAAPSTQVRLNAWLAAKGFQQVDARKYPGVQVILTANRPAG